MKALVGTNPSVEEFPGCVKYSGSDSTGCVKWKAGSLVVEKDESNDWKIKVMYDCSKYTCLALPLTPQTIVKKTCNNSGVLIELRRSKTSSSVVTLFYKSDIKIYINKLKDILCQAQRLKPVGTLEKNVVGLNDKENVAGLHAPINYGKVDSQDKENDSKNSSSVKSYKKDSYEGKENVLSSTKPSEQFLQRSMDKNRQCLSNVTSFYSKASLNSTCVSTPSTRLNISSKRLPGLMPDPTPIKRARLSDSVPYTMKGKPVKTTEVNPTQTLQGFSNLGNTCYMNAILQCLFGLETLASDLTGNKKMLKSFQQHSLFHALVKLLHVKRQTNATDISKRDALRRVKCAISNTAKRFSGYGQHDAHEFLGQVLDQLKEEVIKVSKATPTPNKDNETGLESSTNPGHNPITVNFEFEVLHTLTCVQCKDEVTKTEQFHDISLDVPKQKDLVTPRSLQDAISLFFKNEEIDYTCVKCGHSKSNVTHKISRLPRILILHLKRYSYNQLHSKNTKMGQNVKVPFYLTLQNHCEEETIPPYPPLPSDVVLSEQKFCPLSMEDSRDEDTPSRRRLDYSGLDDTKINPEESSTDKANDTRDLFTETKQKGDEVDSAIPLDYEDDPDLTRAIQMSLADQEEKDKMLHDYGDGNDSNMERVLEFSRTEQNTGTPGPKKLQEMTEEEMIQLAIEQSLQDSEPYHYDNTAQNDDVINNDDHMYSRNCNEFVSDSVDSQESYDIGPDNVNSNISSHSNETRGKRRHNSDSVIVVSDDKLEKVVSEHFHKFSTPDNKNVRHDLEHVLNGNSESCDNIDSESSEKIIGTRKDHLSIENDADSVDSVVDLTCDEMLPDDFEVEKNGIDLEEDKTEDVFDRSTDDENEELPDIESEDIDNGKSGQSGHDEEILGEDEDERFKMEDEDDSWLSNVEDKENKIPSNLTEHPKLSDPSDFTMDTAEQIHSDEVDGFVEENLDVPEIKNEKGELPYTYRLMSVVNHVGMTSVAGHYISDVYDMKKKAWYSYDDTHVTKITESDVQSKRERSGYIFFYMEKEIYEDLALDIAVNKTTRKT